MIKELRGKWINSDFILLRKNPINLKELHIFMASMTLTHGL